MRLTAPLLALILFAQHARAQDRFAELARASLATIDGTLRSRGLRDTVRVVRDSSGVPHIYAKNLDDLFFAQGFVHAQDRLWQMEMYRRIYEGRLAEVLGAGAVRHDRLMRLMKFRGPVNDAEYASYHPEGRRIFQAFANGVNAFLAQAGDNLPVEFKLSGIRPFPWTPEIALLRTQTAMPLGDLRAELRLARDIAQLGVAGANEKERPDPYRQLVVPNGLDVSIIDSSVIASLGGLREGAVRAELVSPYREWLSALPSENSGANENSPGSNNWVVSGRLTSTGRVMLANDPHRVVNNPSIRYLVHLVAPGWDVIGATEPVFPGVMIGHNGRIGWGLTVLGTDQADVYVEKLNPANPEQVRWKDAWEPMRVVLDTIRVKGSTPVVVRHRFTRHGPVFHIDTARGVAYAARSTMYEPGTAGYLSALRYHSLDNCMQFLDAQRYYMAPSENMICGDVHGNIAWHGSGLAPRRAGWDGRLPVPGHSGEYEWNGFRTDLPRELNPARGWIATANHNTQPPDLDPPLFFATSPDIDARYRRIAGVLGAGTGFTLRDFEILQHDTHLERAARDVARFRGWTSADPAVEGGRALLAAWNGRFEKESAAAALYNVMRRLALNDPQPAIERAIAAGLDSLRRRLGPDSTQWRWGRLHRSEFPHALVRAYDIAAIERSGGAGTVASTGATFREIIDFSNFDRSMATNVPGQSGQPGSPFYANLVAGYAAQRYFPLSYSRAAVEGAARARLVLVPR